MFTKFDKKKAADAGTAALVAGLKGVKAVLDTSSIPGASAVFSVILACIDEQQKASRNADLLKSVKAQVEAILVLLEPLNTVPSSAEAQTISHELKDAALDLAIDLSKRARVVEERTKHAVRPAWMTRGSDEEALQDFARTVEDDLRRFQLSQGNRIERHLEAIRADVQTAWNRYREGDGSDSNSAQAIQNHTEAIGVTTSATKALALEEATEARKRDWDSLFRDLHQAPLASYNAERPGTVDGCSDQTRVDLLEEVDGWIADPESDHIYWLKERAGFGKTAIALSVAERAAARGELAASFFFSHQLSDLNNASLFFSTLAFQLALYDQGRYRPLFAEAVRQFPNASTAKLKHQVDALFIKPLQQADSTSRPLVIVIDALDECNRDHAQELIDVLIRASQTISLPLRLFITSRPEHHLITTFEAAGILSRTVIDTSESDVETYLRSELPDIPRKLGIRGLSRDWITEEEILILIRQAGGLFVYASTVVRFIGYSIALNPRKRLDILLREDETQVATYQPYQPLDRLYRRVLDLATDGQPDLVEEVLLVLGARIVLFSDLSLSSLASLLSLEPDDLRRTLVRLQSVVVCPESDNEQVTFHHASFKDFLLDQSRSGSVYFINTSIHHRRLVMGCARIVSQSPLEKEVESILAREGYLPDEAVTLQPDFEYAARNVVLHISKTCPDSALRDAFDEWFMTGAPWWVEPVGVHSDNIHAARVWRLGGGDPPPAVALVVLDALEALRPSQEHVSIGFWDCPAFARKELRRYCRLAVEYPDDPSNDANAAIVPLHTRVHECIPKTEGIPREQLAKIAMDFAQELETILDDFTLSLGNEEEVNASRQHTENMRSRLHNTLVEQHAVEGEMIFNASSTAGNDAASSSDADGGRTSQDPDGRTAEQE